MGEQDRPPSAGELVVRNGKRAGTVAPLTLPVTVIGRGDGCDVRLAAAGVADFHCLVTLSPAGPTLRSWHPDQTLVNGTPTAAAVLRDGDELKVGPCLFAFHWHAPAAAEPPPGPEPDLPPDLLAQLAEARESFRLERERAAAELAVQAAELARRAERVQNLRVLAKAERTKARQVYRRFLKRMQTKWRAERRAVEAERAHLDRDRAAFTSQSERERADRDRQTAQLQDYKKRLFDAWELLGENQRRLLADRQQAEAWVARQTDALDHQAADLARREQKLSDQRATLEARAGSLVAEIAGLEARAVNTRAVLRQLEDQRAAADARAGRGEPTSQAPVSLESPPFHPAMSNEANRLLADLHEQSQTAHRERAKLAAQRDDLDLQAADLADQRAILAEQAAALAVAHSVWHSSEHTTVVELEGLARAVRARELAADERDRGLMAAERERRQREYDLWQLRMKLESWQAALATHEAAVAADRDRADAELVATREFLAQREAALDQVQRTWAAVREQERGHLANELTFWAEGRAQAAAAAAAAAAARTRFLTEAEKLAAQVLTLEERRGAEPRRVRVIRRRWESHFARVRKEVDARSAALAVEQTRADDRLRELTAAAADTFDRQSADTAHRLTADRDRLAAADTDEATVALSIETARRERGERELADLRAEIDRLSRFLMMPVPTPDGEPDVIPMLTRAA